MVKGLKRLTLCLICILCLLPLSAKAAKADLITDFNELMVAIKDAEDGDVILVGDIDFSPLSPDVPNSMMNITIQKSITIKSGEADAAVFLNGGFILSGSKLRGEKLSVRFENIIFDGKADYDALTEKDYEYPWSEAVQSYTYYASLKAQQALSFMGNVDAEFSGCIFKNYMHEYGPVIDIRYGDYTGNEYISLPDYSGCSIHLNFENCRIENNSALYDGGAIYIEANNNVVLDAKNSVFSGNRSTGGQFSRGGGAIYAVGATLKFTDCTLEKNVANHAFSDTVLPEYDTHQGGAILLQSAKLFMTNTIVSENRASVGGGLSFTNTKAELDGCRFVSNRAEEQALNPDGVVGPWSNMGMGGAIYIEGNSNDTVTLLNCEIKNNSATNAYGGIYGFYVPFEDPSFGTYILELTLCTYEGNLADVEYDYTTVGDLAWLSHPGDMFTNPHLTLFGCYITDKTFAHDFPHDDMPTAENGYNYLSDQESEEILKTAIPKEALSATLGERYGDKLKKAYIGSNYTEALYKEEAKGGAFWWIAGITVLALALAAAAAYILRRRASRATDEEIPPQPIVQDIPPVSEKKIVMTRYGDAEIDRFLALVPETGTLTGRELEVLREILRGRKQGEVAHYLGIEVTTVKDFYRKIYTKLNVANKDALFIMAANVLK